MKAVSTKTAARNREYLKLRAVFLGNGLIPVQCAGWPLARSAHQDWPPQLCARWATEVHHTMGRDQAVMLNVATWLPLCSPCHRWATDHPTQARGVGLSRPRYLEAPEMTTPLRRCRSCDRPIIWAKTVPKDQSIPLDADPETGWPAAHPGTDKRGRVCRVKADGTPWDAPPRRQDRPEPLPGTLHVEALKADGDPAGRDIWISHFATCEHAGSWRKR